MILIYDIIDKNNIFSKFIDSHKEISMIIKIIIITLCFNIEHGF